MLFMLLKYFNIMLSDSREKRYKPLKQIATEKKSSTDARDTG